MPPVCSGSHLRIGLLAALASSSRLTGVEWGAVLTSSGFSWASRAIASIAATTSVGLLSYPSLVVANNDYQNGVALLDNNLNQKWFNLTPPVTWGLLDNSSYVVLADLLGRGRPQVISHSNYRNLGIQDIVTGEWLEYFDISGGFVGYNSFPIPVDVDGEHVDL